MNRPAVAALALALVLAGAGARAADPVPLVLVQDNYFLRDEVIVGAGVPVRWIVTGNGPHSVTALDGSFDSGALLRGEQWSTSLFVPGTYTYECVFDAGMTGSIVVAG